MAKKENVVKKNVEVETEEQKSVEMTAPATPAENAEPAPQPATDKPELPKTETKKSTKKAAKKDKSEKDETATDKPKSGKSRLVVKNDAEKQRKAEIAAEVKRLQALNVPKEDIEMLIAAKFPPINKPAEPSKKEVETSARDAMFPSSFEVNGIKFRRLELTAQKITSFNGKEIDSFMPALIDAKNDEPEGCVLCLAFQWDENMLAPTGTKGNGKSLYEKSTGITPPTKFPCDLDMCIVDAVLNVKVEKIANHSLYTEFPGLVEFSVFNKRVKDGWFDCFDAPCEVYLADFHEFDFSNGMFVDLYNK